MPVRRGGLDRTTSALLATAAVSAAAVVAARNGPQDPRAGAWYGRLRKPGPTPAGLVIGAVWTGLELLLAGVGYRLLRDPPSRPRSSALGGWVLTLAGLAGYPWLLFRRRDLAASGATAAAMLASAASLAESARRIDPPAATMTLPLIAWLGFATVLNEELWRRNPRLRHG